LRHIETSRFGRLTIDEGSVIIFPEGLIEFPHIREFAILGIEDYFPFLIFTSVDESQDNICFPLISPASAFPDYQPSIPEAERRLLKLGPLDDIEPYCLVSFGVDQPKTRVNLKQPLVINTARMIGCQVELKKDHLRHREPLDLGQIIGLSFP
jgi:flagellar assembly factor FliW